MNLKHYLHCLISFSIVASCNHSLILAQELGYSDTPIIPGTQWHVHDGKRPQPRVVTPGSTSSPSAPSDAKTLFDGKDLSKWEGSRGGDAKWRVENGYMEAVKGTGAIRTKEKVSGFPTAFGVCDACPSGREKSRSRQQRRADQRHV